MERYKRGITFWVLLLVSVALPTSLLATKQLYHTKLLNAAGQGKGSSIISVRSGSYEYEARTYGIPNYAVQQVWLAPTSNEWAVSLCTNGGPIEDDCTYSADGNVNIAGAITPTMLIGAGVTGAEFQGALNGGTLTVQLSDGTNGLAAGTYVQIY